MKYLLLYLLNIVFFCFSACQHKVDNQLHRAEALMKTSSDSSLFILKELQPQYNKMNDEEKALFGVLYFDAHSRKALKLSPVEYIDFSIDHYTKTNQKKQLASSYLYKARMFKDKREYKDAIQNLLRALELSKLENDNNLLGKIYSDLGQIAGYQNELQKNMEYWNLSIDYFMKSQETDNLARMYMAKGWLYMAMEDYDAALHSSFDALEITTDSITIGDVLNDIGSSYYYKDQIDSALHYMRQSLDYPYLATNMSLRYYRVADVYSYIRMYDSALVYVKEALEYPIDIYFEEECYHLLTKIAIATDDKENLPIYVANHRACQDSIKQLALQPNINLLEELHYSDIRSSEIRNQRLLLIVTIFCLIVIGYFVFRWLYKMNKQKQIKSDEYKAELDKKHQLLEKKQELLLLELADEIERTRAKYADMRKKANFEQRQQLEKNIYNEVLHINDESAFYDKMNKVLNYLPQKLKIEYPDITYKEIVWCCLFMIQLPTTDISLIMDYKQTSLYKLKQRLTKKLNFNTSKELEQMLYEKVNS